MNPYVILLIILLYFGLLYGISLITSRKANNASYYVGNKTSPWFVVAFAMIGTSISGVTFVSVPGWVASTGFTYLQTVLGFMLGYLTITFVLIPLYYKMNLISIYGYIENRFGFASYKTGAWFFLISKVLGAAARMYLVAFVLQTIIFDHIGVPFIINVAVTMFLIFLYTYKGGTKTLIWTDLLQTLFLVLAVILCIVYVADSLNLDFSGVVNTIGQSDYSRVFVFDDWNSSQHFFKQFLAGAFITITMTGLDQDMMQKNLSCKNIKDAQKNVMTSALMFLPINVLFLSLGVLLYTYADAHSIIVEKSDQLFPMLATQYLPPVVGVLFILGLIASACSSAGSALTSLTTSYTVDIMGVMKKNYTEEQIKRKRIRIHIAMAVVLALFICIFNAVNSTSIIDAVYKIASYTYGPILGIFAFGIFTKAQVRDRMIPYVAVIVPIICLVLNNYSEVWFNGYKFSYELLIINGALMFLGLFMVRIKNKKRDEN